MERRPLERVRGTQDHQTRQATSLDAMRTSCESAFLLHSFRRVDVPVLEPAELHLRKSGLEIISKLYSFHDLGGRRICLRPELTASIVRAAIAQPSPRLPDKVFATGPVFRYERPSRGRFRQFMQTGVEVLGAEGVLADAEIIALAATTLDSIGITKYSVTIGNVGILGELLTHLGLTGRRRALLLESLEDARRHGIEAVRTRFASLDPDFIQPDETAQVRGANATAELSSTSSVLQSGATGWGDALARLVAQTSAGDLGRRTLEDVTTRLAARMHADSARAAVDRALSFIEELGAVRGDPDTALDVARALLKSHGLDPKPLDQLSETITLLDAFGVKRERVQIDLGLSRGLQYYTGMVFEVDHEALGAEKQLCGGGRYDDLYRVLGGRQSVTAIGFAFGLERLVLAKDAETGDGTADRVPDAIFIVPSTPGDAVPAARAATALRHMGVTTALDTSGRAARSAISFAAREGFAYLAMVSQDDPPQTLRLRPLTPEGVPADDTISVPDGPIPITSALDWLRANPPPNSEGAGLLRPTTRAETGTSEPRASKNKGGRDGGGEARS